MAGSINDLRDRHAGQMAFVVGAGPSLHFQDLSPLKDYVTLAVNAGILKVPDCDYFVSDDEGARHWNYYAITAAESSCKKLLFRAELERHTKRFDSDDVYLYDHVEGHTPHYNKDCESGFEMTKTDPIIAARTSSGSAAHAAYIMGCDPIVLLGCDACHKYGKRYFWQFPGEQRGYQMNTMKPAYSYGDKGQLKGKSVDTHCVEFDKYWPRVREANPDINIIYASDGGIIDVFPIMTLEEVVDKYRDRIKT